MDTWDDDYVEPNDDDLTARRVVSLAIVLTNASRPLLTSEIRDEIYAELGLPVFRKAFQRDRERLAAAGIMLQNGPKSGKETTWLIDKATFAATDSLTTEDALTLDFLLLPLASDPSYPYASDLRMALVKINRSFNGPSVAALPPAARNRNHKFEHVEHALVQRHAIDVTYQRADGSLVKRRLAPYGIFELNHTTYLVAARMDNGKLNEDDPHTYNLDRLKSVREVSRSSYLIPADFDVRDYQKLPFQLGPTLYEATFDVPLQIADELQAKYPHQGSWLKKDNRITFVCDVSNEQYAVSWCIAEKIHPNTPNTLINTWKEMLERAAYYYG